MKKLCIACLSLCLALTVLAAVPGTVASAEPAASPAVQIVDLSGLSDEELVALLDQVQAEIMTRGIEKTAQLPEGMYIFGRTSRRGNTF